MTQKNLWVLLVTAFAFAALAVSSASAFGNIVGVEVNGVNAMSGVDLGHFSGDRVPVLLIFKASEDAKDVRVKVWLSGERENVATSDRFDVVNGTTYSKVVYLDIPTDLDENLYESRMLELLVENKNQGTADEKSVELTVQRESYQIDILDVTMDSRINSGEPLAIDVVLKNRGSHFADDTFLKVRIPELGIETKAYFGDLSPVDQDDPERDDAAERRIYLRVPANAKAGLYTVQLEAANGDSVARAERKVMVVASGDEARVVSSASTKTFAVGETVEYKLTVVNSGNAVGIYEITADSTDSELSLELSEPIVVVPAGSSRTVSIMATSQSAGAYTFTAETKSEDGTVLNQKTFVANVQGKSKTVTGNATVLLTVILAIVFVVLLVVLIVLLTRKPQKSEEFGESYY